MKLLGDDTTYLCSKCNVEFFLNSQKEECEAFHRPGDCCHQGETRLIEFVQVDGTSLGHGTIRHWHDGTPRITALMQILNRAQFMAFSHFGEQEVDCSVFRARWRDFSEELGMPIEAADQMFGPRRVVAVNQIAS